MIIVKGEEKHLPQPETAAGLLCMATNVQLRVSQSKQIEFLEHPVSLKNHQISVCAGTHYP